MSSIVYNPNIPKYIVYGLVDPFANEIRYIGKTITGWERIKGHWQSSSIKENPSNHKNKWLQKLKNLPKKPKKKYSRVVPGARQSYVDKLSKQLLRMNIVSGEIEIILGLRPAAKSIGGKCNNAGIRAAIKRESVYYGYLWSEI